VATQREIQRFHSDELTVTLSTPGSGPYNVPGVQADFILSNPMFPSTSYLPYLLFGYQPIYGTLFDDLFTDVSDLSNVFVPPFDTTIPPLFDGTVGLGRIEAILPAQWRDMFQPDLLDGVDNDFFHPVNVVLRDNDLLNFKPEAPLLMFYCSEDEQVDPRNAIVGWAYYNLFRGSRTALPIPVGPFTHTPECIAFNQVLSRFLFDAFRI
jgi:hypothetical protein